ncbi:bifunctional 4-hydroxy-2-oxoglutarate aldolase/2-dehydro-3-deoxy-phosphogluconate aldolase [Sphingomonas yunnanensis]|uniref:bifunctional 4-hydroxy-2-oxoglutarate aldolase/2-dehydro-3-deoxy-phosphogluconate aldolase n=1 Tax=Sphingomonas TaxID=13687 RepID=UPI001CA61D24|nr:MULTISPECIES: bifunctional 4-hydroxy-2-oxoglutarate aldolase/2-dehydro-3-deoxy-phosphogluconate aldolase [Sphingomonas]MBY9061545.1 bifunctional 4-hydroxy-2-oxoglutarate aldolase/2-dehydro-3-deoxy-phosphogluconate aldolase [Sphingomonas yunnanensis]
MSDIETVMRTSPVIPVLVIKDAAQARGLAEALVAGGLKVLEVTLRTPAALDAIRAMKEVPGAIVGAGTVVTAEQVAQVKDAGAEFIVSPGLSQKLGETILASGIPWLPGIATAGDIMRGLDMGLSHFKFFPAETSGGIKALKALAAPFYQCRFCPTGGITEASAPDWLALDPVLCVGGSWVTEGTLPEIEARARAAAGLAR